METQCEKKVFFDTVYDANIEKVYKTAFYYSKDPDRAEDITQQVFMKLYENMDNINTDNITAWLITTAKHIGLNARKSYARSNKYEELLPNVETLVDREIYLDSLEDTLMIEISTEERAALAEKIYVDLYKKKPHWYEAITITYILQRPQKEVAETMGVSLGMLQMMLHRAKNWIRKRYQEEYESLN